MARITHTTPSGFLLPSIHATPPFYTKQPNPPASAHHVGLWIQLILSYARHRKLFTLRVEDAETDGNDWSEVFRNVRIKRTLKPQYLTHIIETMVSQTKAVYEPPTQTRSVLLYWRLPEEWAEVLHDWATETGQLNTIMTFYDITDPPLESQMTGMPLPLLRKAIALLVKSGRAQTIAIPDGEGVRFFAR